MGALKKFNLLARLKRLAQDYVWHALVIVYRHALRAGDGCGESFAWSGIELCGREAGKSFVIECPQALNITLSGLRLMRQA